DCFYASVLENENPALRSLPLAVQQKQIVVTCNYEARRRGVSKLQLIKEAKKICPDVVIILGEDLTRFRNASKELYGFLKSFSWNSKVERLGFDEVFLDVSDMISHNVALLNFNDLPNSFFYLSKDDPTSGFAFDASQVAGYTYPESPSNDAQFDPLQLRLRLGSHLAQYLRHQLDSQKSYTCTVGISTNKLLAKLVGNLHKPNSQTTLLSFTADPPNESDNITIFMDGHEVGKIPGIGFKLAQKIRAYVLQRPLEVDTSLVYGGTREKVLVRDVRTIPGMGPETLERILGGAGSPRGIGVRIWGLLNGSDDSEVSQAREVPKQISIEDSYLHLDTLEEVVKELRMLAKSLLKRMHADLLEDDEDEEQGGRWLAFPKTLRLSTRLRPPQNPNGGRNRSFARISRSAPLPNFVFNLQESIEAVSERLVMETIIPLFRRLHPERSGWDLSLVNVAVTNMVDAAGERGGAGRDISKMFKRQDDIEDRGIDFSSEKSAETQGIEKGGSEDVPTWSQEQNIAEDMNWEADEGVMDNAFRCHRCGALMPAFAMAAHERWHALDS
ncbi:DNA/RNA polymerase, partial [Lojkania enalia]